MIKVSTPMSTNQADGKNNNMTNYSTDRYNTSSMHQLGWTSFLILSRIDDKPPSHTFPLSTISISSTPTGVGSGWGNGGIIDLGLI